MMSKYEAKIKREMLSLGKEEAPRIGASLNLSSQDLNADACSSREEKTETMIGLKSQDENIPDAKLLSDLDVEIFAHVSCSEYWKLQFLNKQYSQLLKSGEIFKVRREHGLTKPYVYVLTSGNTRWTMFDKDFNNFLKLPEIPSSDYCFLCSDKETISAGSQLIVIGRELEGVVVWRYELEMSKWFRGPPMLTPRTMYGSATRGMEAFFAGGIRINEKGGEVMSLVEKYNSVTKTWTNLHGMHKRRKFSSGCFLDGKFYVIGGRDEDNKYLTCGERYDEVTDSWELIPNMLEDVTIKVSASPPLVAVVNDNLYLLQTYSNELYVYNTNTNKWKKLGIVPVRADSVGGWGVAFKSLGDTLLLIGAMSFRSMCETMSVYTCRPSRNGDEFIWERSNDVGADFHHFIRNCCVMFA